MAIKKGLGRGFDSLIPTDLFDPTAEQDEKMSRGTTLPLNKLRANPNQPRRHFDDTALEELAASLKEHGLIQPIVVTPKGDDYEIVAGERRYRAAKIAKLAEVPVIIRTLTDQNQLEISLIENIQRRDLNAIETATAYAKLRDQFNLSNDQIAARVHKSVSTVVNTMRLLKLPQDALKAVADGTLTEGQVRPLIGRDEAIIAEILPKIIAEEWSARKIEQYISVIRKKAEAAQFEAVNATAAKHHEERFDRAAQSLKTRLNAPVDIKVNSKGAGKIIINFATAEDLERIQSLLG